MNQYEIKPGAKFFKAFLNFQKEAPVMPKDKKGYGYNYTELKTLLGLCKPVLDKHGLVIMQPLQIGSIDTILVHAESGEGIVSTKDYEIVALKGMNNYQSEGAGISYMRRYAVASILGIVSDEDVDAAAPQPAPKAQPKKATPKKLPATPKDGPKKVSNNDQAKLAKSVSLRVMAYLNNKWGDYFAMSDTVLAWMTKNVNV